MAARVMDHQWTFSELPDYPARRQRYGDIV
jgi:hypothetical protein